MYIRRPGRLLNVLCTFNLDPASRGRINCGEGGGGGGGGAATLLLYSSTIFTVYEGKVRFPLFLFGSSVF